LVYSRLLRSASGWGPGRPLGSEVPAESRCETEGAAAPLPAAEGPVDVVRWADAAVSREDARRLLAGRYGWEVGSFDDGCGDGGERDAALLSRIGGGGARAPVLVVAEAWEPPSKNLTNFLRGLRRSCGSERAIVIGLLTRGPERPGATLTDVRIWRRRVAAIGDARIRVEVLDA